MPAETDELNEKTYRILDVLSHGQELSQREVAAQAGLSLGMVNLILKRLLQTGYIKAASLDRKKMEYILTPKGLAERMARSYQYLIRAYRMFHESQRRVEALVTPLLGAGRRKFVVLGSGEIAQLVQMTLQSKGGAGVQVTTLPQNGVQAAPDEIVLDCRLGQEGGVLGVSVLEEILNTIPAADGVRRAVVERRAS
jgi:DNA-binding MarR family transcriptional regulator